MLKHSNSERIALIVTRLVNLGVSIVTVFSVLNVLFFFFSSSEKKS